MTITIYIYLQETDIDSDKRMSSASMKRGHPVFDTGESVQWDAETGEVISPTVKEAAKPGAYGDCETGEQTQKRLVYQRSKFRVR